MNDAATKTAEIAAFKYAHADARAALDAAIGMGRWNAVAKYAEQLSRIEADLRRAETKDLGPAWWTTC